MDLESVRIIGTMGAIIIALLLLHFHIKRFIKFIKARKLRRKQRKEQRARQRRQEGVVKVLKIKEEYFLEVVQGRKKAEWRFNDREYEVDDVCCLQEIEENGTCTGREQTIRITHLLQGFRGMQKGWCMFSFELINETEIKQPTEEEDDE